MSEWTLERAAAAFPIGCRVLIRGIEVGRVAAVKRLNGDGDPLVQLSDTIWYRPCDLTPLADLTRKVYHVQLDASHESVPRALASALSWGDWHAIVRAGTADEALALAVIELADWIDEGLVGADEALASGAMTARELDTAAAVVSSWWTC